jgi:hypothetical protein
VVGNTSLFPLFQAGNRSVDLIFPRLSLQSRLGYVFPRLSLQSGLGYASCFDD